MYYPTKAIWFCVFYVNCISLTIPVWLNEAHAQESSFKYTGSKTCKPCHFIKKAGAQYKIWLAGPHAKAYETLKSEKALQWGKERGIDEPIKSEKCVKCHVTAYSVDAKLKGPALKLEEGVGCEACHGPGSEYKKLKIMREIYAGNLDGKKYGLIKPTEEVCVTCHNEESPAYKEFKYEEMIAKIEHSIPPRN